MHTVMWTFKVPAGTDLATWFMEKGYGVIGTPDDAIAYIENLLKGSGGFGSIMELAQNWADWDATKRHYELMARYVHPHFQRSRELRHTSYAYARDHHAEFSGQHVFHPNENASGTPGESRTTISLGDYPELRIDFDELVSTGALSASAAIVYGGGLGANWRNYLIQGEVYQIDVTQSRLPGVPAPGLGFSGGYVEGSWVLTGEPHPYDPETAAWARPKPDNPFSIGGGLGAWEIAARYSAVDLNSNVILGVSQTVTGGVYGGRQQIGAVALSWYPNDWLRFMLQFQYVNVDKLNAAGTTQIGQRFETIAARAQAAW